MSTPCELLIISNDKSLSDRYAKEVLSEAKRLEKKYNYYNQNSLLGLINKREANLLDKETLDLIKRAIKYYKKTNKIFDITIGTIKDIYKNSSSLDELNKEYEKLMPYIGCEHIKIKKDKISFDNPYTKIDLGGFVKEYAVDRAAKILKKGKIKSALINFGGDIFALGKKSKDERFRIGIKDPDDSSKFINFIEIEDEALTTSASYERNYKIEDKTFSHILPTIKNPSFAKSVSVVSSSCVESGVYSTSLMIDSSIKTDHKVFVVS
jgi:thiamine biosynthesis lipoprotein